MVGRLLLFWDGLFSRVIFYLFKKKIGTFNEKLPLHKVFSTLAKIFPKAKLTTKNARFPLPDAVKFLDRCYGATWSSEVVVWSHTSLSRQMYRLPLEEYMKAMELAGYQA